MNTIFLVLVAIEIVRKATPDRRILRAIYRF
jgi:hypothetical protein